MTLSTHVLDTMAGRPAAGVSVTLDQWLDAGWALVAQGATDADGRLHDWVDAPLENGLYQLTFGTGQYFDDRRIETLYPYVTVVVEITDATLHHHIPLLLSPYAYSTYRGS